MEYPWFCGPSNPSQAVTGDQERTVNYYFEALQFGSTSRHALYPTPGVADINIALTGVGGGGRAHIAIIDRGNEREFAIIGNSLIELFENKSFVNRGNVLDNGLPATISFNGDGGNQLFITSARNGLVYDLLTDTLTSIASLNARADFGDFMDGYFLCLDAVTSTLLISVLFDGSTWNTGTDFAQRSIRPDPWVSMKVLNRNIYLLGAQTSEVWYNTGDTFPFAPHPSGLINYGCAAPFSSRVVDTTLCWLSATKDGKGPAIRCAGFTPQVISTPAFQNAIAQYSTITDAQGDTYAALGHTFYILSFPEAQATWAWDTTTGLWCERGTWSDVDNRFFDWRPRWHALAFGQQRILHATAPLVLELTTTSFQDVGLFDRGGDSIRRLRRAPAIMAENERIFYGSFELDLQVGIGQTVGAGSDPQIMMRQSN